MDDLPANSLDEKAKIVLRVGNVCRSTLGLAAVAILVVLVFGIPAPVEDSVVIAIILVLYVVLLVASLFILPPLQYAHWRYELKPEYLDINYGLYSQKRCTIPYARIQNTDLRQGPLLHVLGLANLTISTAAKDYVIPGLAVQTAEATHDRLSELSLRAREGRG